VSCAAVGFIGALVFPFFWIEPHFWALEESILRGHSQRIVELDDGISSVMVVVAHNRALKHMCTHIYVISLWSHNNNKALTTTSITCFQQLALVEM
jgi:hypothetical protein